MPTPAWLAATPDAAAEAGQINQFLGTHAATLIYTGVVQSSQTTAGTGSIASNGASIAQSFTTSAGQTQAGRVLLFLAVTGAPAPTTVSIQASVGGAPSGTPLVSTVLPHEFLGTAVGWFSIPVPVGGLTPSTTYWIVLSPAGDASNNFTWSKSNQASGASTSANGTTWTAQSYGLLYQLTDYSVVGPLAHTWEDDGARWTVLLYDSLLRINVIGEWTQGQNPTGYLISARTLAYAAGFLTSAT